MFAPSSSIFHTVWTILFYLRSMLYFDIPMTSNESYEASVLLVLKVLVLNLATKDKH